MVCDLENDKKPEVIQTDESGSVWVFNALDGQVLWQTTVKGKPASPAAADLNGDGVLEIVVTTNEGLVCAINKGGELLWENKIGGTSETWATSSPVVFAASDGKPYTATATSTGRLFCIDQNGNTKWSYPTAGPVASSLSACDFDENGLTDIFLITQTGVVYRFDEKGNLLWEFDMQGRSLAPGAIIDINNDGTLEYMFCTQRGHLIALNNLCEIIFDYQFDNRTINVTPTFGDITRSSRNLEMVITGGESGKTFCFGTPASINTNRQWTAYRRDNKNSGSWLNLAQSTTIRMIPENLFWNQIYTGEDIRFSIYNPTPGKQPLQVSVTCVHPDGSRQTALSSVIGKQGQLRLPATFTIPGRYHFNWSLKNSKDQQLVSGTREVSLQPFANDRSLVKRAINELNISANSVENVLPLSATALRREMQDLQLKTSAIELQQDLVPGSDAASIQETIKKTSALVTHAKRVLKISDVVNQAASFGSGTSLIAFKGLKWENRKVNKQLPNKVNNPLNLKYDVVPGEHQPIPLMLFNITNQLLQVQFLIDPVPDGFAVTPLRSVNTISSLGENSWDAFPELDESAVISIPSFSSCEVWLDVNVGSEAKGDQNLKLRLVALNGAGVVDAPNNPHAVSAPETIVDVSFNVLPFNMAPPGDFRLCTWSPSKGPVVKDLLAHGNNVFNAPHGKPQYDQNGDFGNIDYNDLDEIIREFENHDVILLLNGFPALTSEFGSSEYERNLKKYLDNLVPHLVKLGIDKDHFALYPLDEPGGHGWNYVNKLVEFGKMVREINPKIMMYVDGGGELPMFQAMAPVLDIWVPGIEMLAEDSPEMNIMRNNGKMLWSYNCSYGHARPIGPNIKNINIVAEYRTAALFALRHNATGIGFWCYNAGRENSWERIKLEYNLVYPGRGKPVTSRRWEAVREGIEDYRILAALKKQLQAAKLDKKVLNQIENLLRISLPDLVDQTFKEMKLGLGRDVIDASSNDSRVAEFRMEMMDCVKAVVNVSK